MLNEGEHLSAAEKAGPMPVNTAFRPGRGTIVIAGKTFIQCVSGRG
jgi:hypothetical protein